MDAFGILTIIDLKDCDPFLINSSENLEEYLKQLCELIKMKPYGVPIIKYFGQEKKVEGYSIVQLIETSSITGHFCSHTKNAYIDIFSCAEYSSEVATIFSANYFKARLYDFSRVDRL